MAQGDAAPTFLPVAAVLGRQPSLVIPRQRRRPSLGPRVMISGHNLGAGGFSPFGSSMQSEQQAPDIELQLAWPPALPTGQEAVLRLRYSVSARASAQQLPRASGSQDASPGVPPSRSAAATAASELQVAHPPPSGLLVALLNSNQLVAAHLAPLSAGSVVVSIPVHALQPGTLAIYLGHGPSALIEGMGAAAEVDGPITEGGAMQMTHEVVNRCLRAPTTRVALVPVLPADAARELCRLLPAMARQVAGPSPAPASIAATHSPSDIVAKPASSHVPTHDGLDEGWGVEDDTENASPVAQLLQEPAPWMVGDTVLQLPPSWQGMLSHAWQQHFAPLTGDLDLLLAHASTLAHRAAVPSYDVATTATPASSSVMFSPGLHGPASALPGQAPAVPSSCSASSQAPAAYASSCAAISCTADVPTGSQVAAASHSPTDLEHQRVLLTSIVQFLLDNGLHHTASFLLSACSTGAPAAVATPTVAVGSNGFSGSCALAPLPTRAMRLPRPMAPLTHGSADRWNSLLYSSSAGSTAYLSCSPGSSGDIGADDTRPPIESISSCSNADVGTAVRTPLAFAMAVQELRTRWQNGHATGAVLPSPFAHILATPTAASDGDGAASAAASAPVHTSFQPSICAPLGGPDSSGSLQASSEPLMYLMQADSTGLPGGAQHELPAHTPQDMVFDGQTGCRTNAAEPVSCIGRSYSDHATGTPPCPCAPSHIESLIIMSPPYTPQALAAPPSQRCESPGSSPASISVELSPAVSLSNDSPARMQPLLSAPTSAQTPTAPLHPNYAPGDPTASSCCEVQLATEQLHLAAPGKDSLRWNTRTPACDFCFSPVKPSQVITKHAGAQNKPLAAPAPRSSWQQWQQATCSDDVLGAHPSSASLAAAHLAIAGAPPANLPPPVASGPGVTVPLSVHAASRDAAKPDIPQGNGTPKGLRMALRLLGGASPVSSPGARPVVTHITAAASLVAGALGHSIPPVPSPAQVVLESKQSASLSQPSSLQLPVVLPVVPYQLPQSHRTRFCQDRHGEDMACSLLLSAYLIPGCDARDAEDGSAGGSAGYHGMDAGYSCGTSLRTVQQGCRTPGSGWAGAVAHLMSDVGRGAWAGCGWAISDVLALVLCSGVVAGLVLLILKAAMWAV